MKIFIRDLIDVIKVYKLFRKIRWKNGCHCLFCGSNKIHKKGWHSRHEGCQRYKCLKCHRQFDDLTGTVFSGRHQSVVVWVLYCYFMGLNVSNSQIAQELGLCQSDSHAMGDAIRTEVYEKKPIVTLSEIAELDEVYIIAGHKGFPAAIKDRKPRRNRLKGARGRGYISSRKTARIRYDR